MATSAARNAARRVVKDYMLGFELPALYRRAAAQPVDERLVLFVNVKLGFAPEAFSVIMPYLEDNYDFDVRFVGLNQAGSGFRSYHERCRRFVQQMARAKYVFLEDASDVVSCLPLRPETRVVQLWHACGAFKRWGLSTADKKFGASRRQIERHPYYGNLSLVTVSSPEVEWAYREAMGLAGDVVQPVGVSRTDVFFDGRFVDGARQWAREHFGLPEGKKVILYAPTFRGAVKEARSPDAIDFEELKRAVGDEYCIVVKHHPFVKSPPAIPHACAGFAFEAGSADPVDKLMCAADVLVTDYSSVIFEYSLLERPMVFLAPDKDDYVDWRGFYYPYEEMAPGPVVQDSAGLVRALESVRGQACPPEGVRAFREKFMAACDGASTRRICEHVFGEELEPRRKAPIAQTMRERFPEAKDVSIVVAAYNAQATLGRCLDSVLAQTYPLERVEVIVVDDCSTDETREIAGCYEASHPDSFKLLHTQVQSGSPSQPRNLGLEQARGEYLFFMDSDDWLGCEAVERMLRHAHDWRSDVLVVKLAGEGGRAVPLSMFGASQPEVDAYCSKVMWTFGPYKLFRRELVRDLRFPDFMPEDISFVLRAYDRASRVSVAADYEYYHLAYAQGPGANISLRTWDDVTSNIRAYEDVFGFIAERVAPEQRKPTLLKRLFGRDVCATLETIGRRADEDRACEELLRLVQVVGPFYDKKALATLPQEKRALLDAAFGWL